MRARLRISQFRVRAGGGGLLIAPQSPGGTFPWYMEDPHPHRRGGRADLQPRVRTLRQRYPVPGALVAGGQRRPGGGASRVFGIIRPAVTHHRAFPNFSNLSFSLFIGKTLAGSEGLRFDVRINGENVCGTERPLPGRGCWGLAIITITIIRALTESQCLGAAPHH